MKGITCKPIKVNILGMSLDEWRHKTCLAHCAVGETWATIYDIQSKNEGRGYATELLIAMKEYYERQGLKFGGSVALNERMAKLYQKCGIREYF